MASASYDSTLRDNQSNRAGAIHNNAQGALNLRNVTISGNWSGIESGTGGVNRTGFAVLDNVTITGNEGTSDRAGGILTAAGATTATKNSIVAANLGNGGADDCAGATLTATPYVGADGTGAAGASRAIRFNVLKIE